MSDLHTHLLAKLDEMTTAMEDDRYPMLAPLAALRAVVELHEPRTEGRGPGAYRVCIGCDAAGYDWEHPDWPCSTIQAIADQLGLTEGTEDRG